MSNIHVPSRTGREFLAPAILLIAAICSGRPATAFAQGGDSTPSQIYGAAFEPFYEGEYKDALETFVNEARGGIKTAQSRWIDSICYETMVAECHYHMGSLDEALKHYNAALQLFVAYSDWMLRVQFQPIRPMNAKAVPWGTSSRRSRLGFYPTSYSISQGRVDNMQQYKHGGVVQPATLFPINVVEIVRCTALAIRRRAAILGPVAPYDELTNSVVAALTRGVAPPNHWSEAWAQVNLGLALVAAGKEPQGISALKQSLMAAGEFDHPLTCVALLELGKLALQNGDYPAAATYFEEASYSAFHYSDLDVIEESLRLGALTHLLANRQGMYPPLAIVAQWAKTKQYRVLQASMLLCAAENALLMNRTADAGKLLDECRNAIGRRTMASGRIGARASYVGAAALFQQRRVSDGDAELANAMAYMRRGSIWLYQISMVDTLWVTKALKTNRIANDLYSVVLRDPQIRDWHLDPMEALAVLGTPHAVAFEHWFEVALERKEHEAAIEIADRTRRHRFFSTLPFGGRLDSLRWLLEGPKEYLDMQAQLSRQDLLTRYAEYAKLQTQVVQLRKALAASPLVAPDQSALKQQQQIYAQVAALSMQQEAVLREMAVRREAAPMVFPPLKSLGEVQKSLPKGSAMLVFFATSKQLHGFLLNNERYTYWTVASVAGLTRQMQALFRELGMHQANYELKAEELDQSKWQPAAASAFELLMRGSRADLTQGVEELIVVPDGLVWYLPFELMAAKFDGVEQPLIMRLRVRYVPTMSLANAPGHPRNATGHTAVVAGRLHPQHAPTVAQDAFQRLSQVVPGAVMLAAPLPAPSALLSTFFERLVVFDDFAPSPAPYDWPPVPIERGKGNQLADWLWLPWGGPEEIILPGFHTAIEDSMKSAPRTAPGQEMFLTVCGLLSTGARTVLLSRWRTGGKSSFDLVQEFVQELPHTTPADAWQRAVLLLCNSRIDPDLEPRMKSSQERATVEARHPFFWAGYMLVDIGAAPAKADAPLPEDAVVRPLEGEAPLDGPTQPAPAAPAPPLDAAGVMQRQ